MVLDMTMLELYEEWNGISDQLIAIIKDWS